MSWSCKWYTFAVVDIVSGGDVFFLWHLDVLSWLPCSDSTISLVKKACSQKCFCWKAVVIKVWEKCGKFFSLFRLILPL